MTCPSGGKKSLNKTVERVSFFCRITDVLFVFLVIPVWANETLGLTAFEIGFWFTLYPFAACVTSFIGAYLCVYIGRSKTVILGNKVDVFVLPKFFSSISFNRKKVIVL